MIVVGVSNCNQKTRTYQTVRGELRIYRHPVTKAFFYENGKFGTKYLKGLEKIWWRTSIEKIKTYVCEECGLKYRSNKKNPCPRCGN